MMQEGAFREDLRWILVAFLFSLTIAEIARQLACLVQRRKWNNWSLWKFWKWDDLCLYTYLLLIAGVITTSWLGWSISVNYDEHIQRIFSRPFVILLVDLALVISYFVLANSPKIREPNIVIASATNETVGIVIVFLGYLLWDLASYGLNDYTKHWEDIHDLLRARATLICFVLALVAWL